MHIDPGVLPDILQELTFGSDFNQPIDQSVLPEFLKSLAFGSYFNQPVEMVPKFLTRLWLYIQLRSRITYPVAKKLIVILLLFRLRHSVFFM